MYHLLIDSLRSKFKETSTHLSMQHYFYVASLHLQGHNTGMLGILERIFPSEHVFNSYFVIQ